MSNHGAPHVIDQVVFINLRRRTDRLARVRQLIDGLEIQDRVTIMEAVDALDVDDRYLGDRGYASYSSWALDSPQETISALEGFRPRAARLFARFWSRELQPADLACSLSHHHVWNTILERGWHTTLVLEDDVILLPHGLSALEEIIIPRLTAVDPVWHLLYAGRNRLVRDEVEVDQYAVRAGFSYCTHAYVLTREWASRLLEGRLEQALVPIDEFVPAMYCEHPRPDIAALFAGAPRLRAYATKVVLAAQGGSPSDIDPLSQAVDGDLMERLSWAFRTAPGDA